MRLTIALITVFAAGLAHGQTCKYVDSEGRVVYSDVPIKNARQVTCLKPVKPPPESAQQAPSEGAATPAPKVDTTTQRQRDDQRRSILESELAAEQEQLGEARRALAEQEAIRLGDERNYQRVLDRLKPYQDAVALHEKNIASIKQELASLR